MELQRSTEQQRTNGKPRRQRKKRNVFDEQPEEQSPKKQDSGDESSAAQVVGLDTEDDSQQLGGVPFTIHTNVILAHTGALEERNHTKMRNLVKNEMYYGEGGYDHEHITAGEVSPLIQIKQESKANSEQQLTQKSTPQGNRITMFVGGKPQNNGQELEASSQSSIFQKIEKTPSKTKRKTRQVFAKMEQDITTQPANEANQEVPSSTEEIASSGKDNVLDETSEPHKQRTASAVIEKVDQAMKEEEPATTGVSRVISIDSEQSFKEFFNRPLPNGTLMQCEVRRFAEGFNTRFQLYLDDMRPLMCAVSQSSITTNYHISMNRDTDRKSKYYLGKLRSNFSGSLYSIYNVGENPKKEKDPTKQRSTIVNIEYQTNFLGLKGPRKLKVRIPNVDSKGQYPQSIYKLDDDTSLQAVENRHRGSVSMFINKEPRWNDRLKSYALNFGGRVKQASIKNFILVRYEPDRNEKSEQSNCLVFGKINKDKFNLEFTYPFSPLQAFGVVLSSFDNKLSCQ